MELLLLSFAAGFLTVLAPCILPVLPVIIGGSLTGPNHIWKPLRIIASLAVSIVLFTLLLKATVWFIGVPFSTLALISGGIILLVGLTFLFPKAWDAINFKLQLFRSESLIQKADAKGGVWGDILLGAALGPIFSSCSPTYAIIVATVLPQSYTEGVLNLAAYSVGLALPLLLIAFVGQKIIKRFRFAANPGGWFRKVLGLLLVLVGVAVMTGVDKKIEIWLIENDWLGSTALEQQLVEVAMPEDMKPSSDMGNSQGAESEEREKATETPEGIKLPFHIDAPELQGLTGWINSDPLTMNDLKGKVVIVDFWTYSCINCIRTLPYLRDLHEKYADMGLVILGVHAPEFAFEKLPENVQRAAQDYELLYPIAQDNDFATWRAYSNRYWPAKYLIDKDGKVRYTHFGEGAYEETEQVVRFLLSEGNEEAMTMPETFSAGVEVDFSSIGTPEIYVGAKRQDKFGSGQYEVGVETVFERPEEVEDNTFYLTGTWIIEEEHAELVSGEGSIIIRYDAPGANIVLERAEEVEASVLLDGELTGMQAIQDADLYAFARTEDGEAHTLEVSVEKGAGLKAYAFTFGNVTD